MLEVFFQTTVSPTATVISRGRNTMFGVISMTVGAAGGRLKAAAPSATSPSASIWMAFIAFSFPTTGGKRPEPAGVAHRGCGLRGLRAAEYPSCRGPPLNLEPFQIDKGFYSADP